MKVCLILVFFTARLMAEPFAQTAHEPVLEACTREFKGDLAEFSRAEANSLWAASSLSAQAHCCKVCRKSQACGNSCISWDKTCHQPPGCACQG